MFQLDCTTTNALAQRLLRQRKLVSWVTVQLHWPAKPDPAPFVPALRIPHSVDPLSSEISLYE
jgi:hypothetical protein